METVLTGERQQCYHQYMTKTRTTAHMAHDLKLARQARDGYYQLLKLAMELGMEYEVDRLARNLDEMDAEVDGILTDAIRCGFGPEDLGE
jgi:hypothetical protein